MEKPKKASRDTVCDSLERQKGGRGKKAEKEKDREEAEVIGQAYILGEKPRQSNAEGMQQGYSAVSGGKR